MQVFNALSAGLVMGIMIVPTIASVSEDAMSAVPGALREGAFGLGASKLQVSTRVVFPAALSGIVAAIVLGVSRGIGETMIALIAAGQIPNTGLNPTQPFETITTFIGATAKGDNPAGTRRLLLDLRLRHDPVRADADHERDLDPLRAQVQAGLRVSAPPPAPPPTRRPRPCRPRR